MRDFSSVLCKQYLTLVYATFHGPLAEPDADRDYTI
jgi:hypothetical protein